MPDPIEPCKKCNGRGVRHEASRPETCIRCGGTKREPIMVPCEGSNIESPHDLCPMCGWPAATKGIKLPQHERRDVLAMLARGDFG